MCASIYIKGLDSGFLGFFHSFIHIDMHICRKRNRKDVVAF